MSDLRQYLNHLSSNDYKISLYSKQQQTIRTYQYSTKQSKQEYNDSLESSGFSFSGSQKGRQKDTSRVYRDSRDLETDGDKDIDKGSQGNWESINNNKYLSYNPDMFIQKAQQLIRNRNSNISLNNLTELMNQALEILNVIEGEGTKNQNINKNKSILNNSNKKKNNEVFANRLMKFLEWVQDRIQIERTRSTERKRSKEIVDNKIIKRRQFYDKSGKVTIQIKKIGVFQRKSIGRR